MSFIADEIFHLAFTLDDHLKLFGHGISKGGKIDGVQCYTEFCQRLLQFIDIAGSRHLVFLSNFRHFHFDIGVVNYQAVQNMNVKKF